MFARGAQFFALEEKVKAAVPCDPATFVGWERDAEVSPATGQLSPYSLAPANSCCVAPAASLSVF